MFRILLLSVFLSLSATIYTNAQLPVLSTGSIRRIENFQSNYVAARTIDIWLPEGYSAANKYAVLYMQDGQMLFDATHTWTKQEWGVDETAGRLIKEKKIKACIVVGIWNSGSMRHTDYFPRKPLLSLPARQVDSIYKANRSNGAGLFAGEVQSDNYLRFIVTELKPYIDQHFSVYTDAAHTFIAGSSMGGLISMYAICEYPQVFGGAACLSTHWPGVFTTVNNPVPDAFLAYLSAHLPSAESHRLYFDYGTATLDTMYAPYQQRADIIIRSGNYSAKNFMTKVFKGADHSEQAWNNRLEIPLQFLLSVKK